VRQHILGVVDNVISRFVGNMTVFPGVKNFENQLKLMKLSSHEGGTFLKTL